MESDHGGYRTGNTYRGAYFKGARLHRWRTVSSDLWRWGVRCKHPGAYRISQKQGKTVTISTTQPEGRFGALRLDDTGSQVLGFKEKARADQAWVNIGFMVMEPSVYPYLGDGSTMLETLPFERLAADGQMAAYKHMGFWSPMDNIHDREYLQKLWDSGNAPWKV